jgi:hypothetical protein
VDDESIRKALASADQKPSKLAKFLIEQGFDSADQNEWRENGIPDVALALILEYYAYECQERYRTKQAKLCCRVFRAIGIRTWVQQELNWNPDKTKGEPHWYHRLRVYREKTKIPIGYFSIFEEITGIIGDLESAGYVLKDGLIPDVSVGLCWASYLRSEGISVQSVAQKYKHYYPDWAHSIKANIYPVSLLPKFKIWLEETYKPKKMYSYFRSKDPESLPSVCKILGLPEGQK